MTAPVPTEDHRPGPPRPRAARLRVGIRRHRALLAILALAAVARAAVLLATPNHVPFGDAADYDRLALSLSYLGDYGTTGWAVPGGPTAFRGPAYPYLLSWAYDLTGLRYVAARGLGAALGVVSVALVWAIADRVWGRRVAVVAGAICALLPALVWLPGGLVAENLFVPLVLGAVLAAVLHRERPRLATAIAVGVLCGLAALTRSNGLIVFVPLLIGLWTAGRRIQHPAAALLALVVVLAPWAVRNLGEFDRLTPLGTSSGYTLAGAWNPESARGGPAFAFSREPPTIPAWGDLFTPARFDESQLEQRLRTRALRYGRDHPGFVVRATGAHVLRQFLVGPGQAQQADLSARELGIPDGSRWPLRPALLLTVLLAALAAVLVLRRLVRPGPWWLWLVPLAMLASTAPIVGGPRYRIPLDPFLALAAAVAVVWLADLVRARRAGPGSSPGGGTAGEPGPGLPAPGTAAPAAPRSAGPAAG